MKSLPIKSHFGVVFHRGERGHVAREAVVVSVGATCLWVDVEVVLPISWPRLA